MRNEASAYWIDTKAKIHGNSTNTLEGILADAASKQDLVTVILYDLPNRDCHAKASNGEICCTYNSDRTCNYDAAGDCSDGLAEYKSTYVVCHLSSNCCVVIDDVDYLVCACRTLSLQLWRSGKTKSVSWWLWNQIHCQIWQQILATPTVEIQPQLRHTHKVVLFLFLFLLLLLYFFGQQVLQYSVRDPIRD